MDFSAPQNLVTISDPIEMPVSELLTGNYHFSIPSYQRGYRWESKVSQNDKEVRQVDDLLNDLKNFVIANANATAANPANYYLQPLMVKPRYDEKNRLVWDVLDGQQRLTTLLLILKCLNEKLCDGEYPLYTISYANRPDIDFSRITYDEAKIDDYDYPAPNQNLDSFFIRKAKDRIEEWFKEDLTNRMVKDRLKEALTYEDNSRDQSSTPGLRVLFIWYNASPLQSETSSYSETIVSQDIAIFNRLNGGKISLTDSELLKALFLLCVKTDKNKGGHCLVDEETLVRKWDEMERKFQDNEFWNMLSSKSKKYENRLDFLFDFIRESDSNAETTNSYRYYYNDMKPLLTECNSNKLDAKWEEIKDHFDILCKWHENTTMHNYIGFLIENGKCASSILKEIKDGTTSAIVTIKDLIKNIVGVKEENLADLRYSGNEDQIRKILLLFNVEVSEKHRERFSYDQYKSREYDIEHINSQTDYAIVKPLERMSWITEQALASLTEDLDTMTKEHVDYNKVESYIKQGNALLEEGELMKQNAFNQYRESVELYYACANSQSIYDKDWIGNLTLLNSTINREYKNALYPQKLRTIKRSDQEGEYIPPCTRYLFLKYYSEISGSTSAFNMMRWSDKDQGGYYNAIVKTLKEFL